jgi:hypothetical protein
MNQASAILASLLLFGLMGLIGQGIRAVVGLKNSAAAQATNPTEQSAFNAAYLLVSLMIGFIAGVVAGLALNWDVVTGALASGIDIKTLLGIVAAGYAGADFIENSFSNIIPNAPNPVVSPKITQSAATQAAQPQISTNMLVDTVPSANPPKIALATHLIGTGQSLVSADDIIAMLNDNFTQQGTGSSATTSPFLRLSASQLGNAGNTAVAPTASKDWTSADLTRDMKEASKYRPFIKASGLRHNLAASLICAVGSRESNWGLSPEMHPKGPSGTGDWAKRHGKMPPDGLGWGRGLMQADYAASSFAKDAAEWTDPQQNIEFGCNELASDFQHYKTKFSNLPADKQLQAAIAAYNTGPGNVDHSLSTGHDIDSTTAGHDYSADVLSRAAWFKANGFDDQIASI